VDGSLWTIPIEVHWYAILLLAGVLRILQFKWIVLAVTVIMAIAYFVLNHGQPPIYAIYFGLFFCAGVCLQLFQREWLSRALLTGAILLCGGFVLAIAGHDMAAVLMCLPYLVVAFGVSRTPFISDVGRFGDFSYGVYIYGFPIQQIMILQASRFAESFWGLIAALILTTIVAAVSWHVVEKHALKLKPSTPKATSPSISPRRIRSAISTVGVPDERDSIP